MREYSWHFYCRPVSVFYSLCRYQIDLSCHCGRSAGGVEFLSDCNGSASDLYLLFGRHFCGYACAFGSFGDAVYEGFSWIRMKCFHKKRNRIFPKNGSRASESQIYRTGTDPAFLPYRCIRKAYGNQPVGCFSMLTAGRLPNSKYLVGIVLLVLIIVGMCTQERFFCQFLCPMGAVLH